MARKTKKTGEKSRAELDFGGLFSGLGELVETIGELAEAGEKHIERHGEFRVKGLGDQGRGVFGVSIRSGIGGTGAKVEPFGNVHAGEEGLVVEDVREPLVDIFDEDKEVVITAELPGVKEADIRVRFDGDVVTIETGGQRRYAKEALLPAPVDARKIQQSYNNGVLEIRAAKQPAKRKKGA